MESPPFPPLVRVVSATLLVIGIAVLILPSSGFSQAASGKVEQLVVTYVAVSGSYGALFLAKERGLFEKHRLEVELKYLNPTAGVQAMTAGSVHLYAGGTAALEAAVNGADLVYVASIVDQFVLSLFGLPGLESMAELKGKTLGVTQPGTPSYYGALLLLKRHGLEPDRDVKITFLRGLPEIFAALKGGVIQAGITAPPLTIMARKAGLKELVDIGKLKIPFPQTAFAVMRPFLATHRDSLIRFLKGYSDGVKLAKANRGLTEQVLAKYTKVEDPAINAENYAAFSGMWEPIPYMSEAGIKTALGLSANPKAYGARASDFLDNSLVDELVRSGFASSPSR